MATFSAAGNTSGYDFRQFNLAWLDYTYTGSVSTTLIRGYITPNWYQDLSGSFAYDGEGYLVGGTLSGYSETINGSVQWSFANMTMSAYNFVFYYYYYDNAGFLNEALGGNDQITGSGFNDYLIGLGGVDTINGGNGDDWLDGGFGADTLNGGEGNDTYLYDGTDTINDSGSSNSDMVVTGTWTNLAAMTGVENVTLLAGYGPDVLGTNSDNIFWGNWSGTMFAGQGGNDTIYAYGGDDTLIGGAGADVLYGGMGNDTYRLDDANDTIIEDHVNILWRNKLSGENYVWGANGIDAGRGGDLGVAYVPLSWEVVGTGDFNRDGTSDILWRNNQTGENHLWHMTDISPHGTNLSRAVIPLEWKVVATADFDGDGYTDILWRNSQTGENHLWHMQDTTFLNGVNLSRAVITLDWDVVGAADFNNDGHTDILWRNNRTGDNHLWYMNDNTFIAGVNLSVPVIPLEWKVEAMSDFNADGHVDILWRNYATGENHLWYMNNATVTAGYNLSIATVSLDWEIVGAIDTGGWGGSDTIVSSVSYTLATSGIENLRLDGNGNINGTGDDNANLIMGNPGNNVLDGRGGNDVLDGSAGVDTYTGGAGSDRFVIRLQSSSVDQITDFQTGVGGDVLDLRSIWLGMTPPQNVNASNIGNYVQLSVVSGNTLLSVDFDGTGPAGAEALVTLNGLTGLDPLTLLQQGNLLVS